jgi:hypothetical protein
MPLPISRYILASELKSSRDILDKWIKDLDSAVPGDDFVADEKTLYMFVQQMCSELSLVSGKLDSIYSAIVGK